MYIVYYYENRNLLLHQLRQHVPAEGEEFKIKGRKAKVLSIQYDDTNRVSVHVSLESVSKKAAVDLSKKKKR
ncbi:hypothetical protein D3H55_09190 [Bacillus salacetis]|uniref:Uncharacterized protein n=1 Tax=Bacillus salacetis TaxID=2315464 RepID=A0A3A1R2S4_9BACI|nr:hypothetical protein [Bacillus salacetis]RIW34752.1 hypothetical protein D3H55_09190 [Bacillus salacetis]